MIFKEPCSIHNPFVSSLHSQNSTFYEFNSSLNMDNYNGRCYFHVVMSAHTHMHTQPKKKKKKKRKKKKKKTNHCMYLYTNIHRVLQDKKFCLFDNFSISAAQGNGLVPSCHPLKCTMIALSTLDSPSSLLRFYGTQWPPKSQPRCLRTASHYGRPMVQVNRLWD